ncbi:MAG: metallophosphoesterase [Planctomycetota bacterium]
MRLLGITDLHGSRGALGRIIDDAGPADAVLLGGDITHFGSPDDAEELIRMARASGAAVLAVAGNCDSAEIDDRLVRLGVSLHGRGTILEGLGLHGLSATPPWFPRMYQFTEEELAVALEAGYAQVTDAQHRCVLAHVPPYGLSLDRVLFGRHVGSKSLRTFVDRTEPALVVCGHIHESLGIEQSGRTTLVNCGQASKGHYAVVDVKGDGEVACELRRA